MVWEFFTIETVSPGCRRACCKQCKQSFAYSTGSKVAGTSHLKRHIAKGTCPALIRNQGNQFMPYTPGSGNGTASDTPKRRHRSPSSPYISFDADRCRHEIAKMIIMHDYPLHMVEHGGFVTFVQNLQPRFGMVSFNTVQGDCVATYLREKQNVMKFIEGMPGRVCLTLDMWTSSQSLGIAKDVLWAGRDVVKKIRDSVKYVKTSESHEEKFVELKEQLQVPSERSLSLDDQSQWNTTYLMLVAASELKEVFSCLDTSDPDYKDAPSMEHWRRVETICACLRPLCDAANILTSTNSPTAITFFQEVWKIHNDLARAVASEDPLLSGFTKAMQEKISKYWKDCSLVLAIAVVMDPRFKMKLVEFSFSKLYGEDAPTYTKIVDDGIHELFLEYVALPLPLTPTYADEGNSDNNVRTEDHQGALLSDNGLTDFDMYIMETTGQQMKSELDQYLEESLLPRVHEFDVLSWWKLNKLKYPTLSKMARDILTIPVSTAAPDSVFDTVNKELDQYRSSLRPETVEALVCAKDWLQYGSVEVSNGLVKMEF
ncbi:hypothetical protein GH714_015215 [Hevea brasiliensis]|uniref:BED-type domain-containing protein n=1 Tax=Hevea brasiliensis TaxID=3981 RepID=A0A6A6MCF9_HEVBR|nr:hypothetical protein GH714_015215 [Hevea brasiliensis]